MTKFVTLGEISDISLGRDFRGTIKADKCGEIAVLQPKEIFSESIDDVVFVKEEKVGVLRDRLLKPGDILCSNRYKFVSMLVKNEWLSRPVIANSGLFIIRLNGAEYLPEYISAYLNCYFEREERLIKSTKHEHEAGKKRETVRLLTKSGLMSLNIPMKPLDDQRKFADNYKNLLSNYRERIKSIEEQHKVAIEEYATHIEILYGECEA